MATTKKKLKSCYDTATITELQKAKKRRYKNDFLQRYIKKKVYSNER